ncbi:hypothetical protein SAMN04488087_0180 [Rhodothermus profundi]|uniref:Uncharacterized protein n=1 Tax=Rhodothermus profundi TaxID=633813 RepID=A0A1M6PGY4_9BACT|nr:hypothetical protein SAMN04488087_0180 [Rhodothermus profundi]
MDQARTATSQEKLPAPTAQARWATLAPQKPRSLSQRKLPEGWRGLSARPPRPRTPALISTWNPLPRGEREEDTVGDRGQCARSTIVPSSPRKGNCGRSHRSRHSHPLLGGAGAAEKLCRLTSLHQAKDVLEKGKPCRRTSNRFPYPGIHRKKKALSSDLQDRCFLLRPSVIHRTSDRHSCQASVQMSRWPALQAVLPEAHPQPSRPIRPFMLSGPPRPVPAASFLPPCGGVLRPFERRGYLSIRRIFAVSPGHVLLTGIKFCCIMRAIMLPQRFHRMQPVRPIRPVRRPRRPRGGGTGACCPVAG